jgi:hypothetical protein
MFDFFFRPKRASRQPHVDDLIRQIAKRSAVAVRRRLSDAATTMSDAELRGYVRARGLRPVQQEAERIAAQQGWQVGLTDLLVPSTLERTVHLVVQQLRLQPVVAPSAVYATLRVAS